MVLRLNVSELMLGTIVFYPAVTHHFLVSCYQTEGGAVLDDMINHIHHAAMLTCTG
jgi:hypothetical protein